MKDHTIGDAEALTITLEHLIHLYNIQLSDIKFIKCDTDGYDAECLMSLGYSLKHFSPYIFWENAIFNQEQYEEYNKLSDYLTQLGYSSFFVFDNFGNYLGEFDVNGIKVLNNFMLRMINNISARTFYYVDILSCKQKDRTSAIRIVEKNLRKFDK